MGQRSYFLGVFNMRMTGRSLLSPLVLTFALFACGPLTAGEVYVALGDSNVFGNDESVPSSTMPNYGDQGYVRPFADFLGTLNGGVRPQVVESGNLRRTLDELPHRRLA